MIQQENKIIVTKAPHTCMYCQEMIPAGSKAQWFTELITEENDYLNRQVDQYLCMECVSEFAKEAHDES
jgi:hypothetical protein